MAGARESTHLKSNKTTAYTFYFEILKVTQSFTDAADGVRVIWLKRGENSFHENLRPSSSKCERANSTDPWLLGHVVLFNRL